MLTSQVAQSPTATWEVLLANAIAAMLSSEAMACCVPAHHKADTPKRVVKAYTELFSGVGVNAASVLCTSFEEGEYDEMVHVESIDFTSVCMHHLLPFSGKAHFAYLPDKKIVGLSKIPRLIEVLAHRPQIQEQLTRQIGQVFMDTVQPKGCGVVMYDVSHSCTAIRGVRKPSARMRTTALFGCFKSGSVKSEFLGHTR